MSIGSANGPVARRVVDRQRYAVVVDAGVPHQAHQSGTVGPQAAM